MLSKSLDKAKNAVYSSVFSSIRKKVKNETDFEIEQSSNGIKNKLNEYINSMDSSSIQMFDEEENYINIIKNLLYEKNEKKELKEETKKVVKELINDLRNKNEEILGKCMNDFIQQKSYELSNQLLEIQTEVSRENDRNLKSLKSPIEFQEESKSLIFNAIVEVAKAIGFFNNIRSLPFKFIDSISNKIKKELSGIINDRSINNVINTNIRSQFEKILSTVKNFMF